MGLFGKKSAGPTRLYLPRVLITHEVYEKHGWLKYEKSTMLLPIDAPDAFMTEEEAANYFPIFLRNLTREGLISKENLFNADKTVNESYCKTVVVPINLSQLEVENGQHD